MSEFFVGQKVVCVDDAPYRYNDGSVHAAPLKRGEIYTIRRVSEYDFEPGISLAVWVVGVFRPDQHGNSADSPFGARRFIPLEYKAMSIFRAIAANPKIKIRESA